MTEIIGHDKQKLQLDHFLCGKKVHHGFLLYGPLHVGKMTIARAFARALVRDERQVLWMADDRMDSDIVIVASISEEKKKRIVQKSISNGQINEAMRIFALAADKKRKVLIIDDADRMTISAQNALLKTLEEPQGDRFVILIAHRSDRLLDTIASRCFSMSFSLIDDIVMSQFFDAEIVDEAQGRPGLAHHLLQDADLHAVAIFARDQLRGLSGMTLIQRMQLAALLAKKDEKYIELFLQAWVYRIRRAAIGTQKYHLLKIAERTENTLSELKDTNVNKQLMLEDLLIHIV